MLIRSPKKLSLFVAQIYFCNLVSFKFAAWIASSYSLVSEDVYS